MSLCRSWLFTPGDKPAMVAKALDSAADVVCLDLEDAVAPGDKEAARLNALQNLSAHRGDRRRALRINSLRTAQGLQDILAFREAGLADVILCLPRVDTPDEVRWAVEILGEEHCPVLAALIETPRGMAASSQIALGSHCLRFLLFGAVDYAALMGMDGSDATLAHARASIVQAARLAEIDAIDVPCVDFRNLDEVARQTRLARSFGFAGKAAIHPSNITVIHEALAPDAAELREAAEITAAFEAAGGGVTTLRGKLVERPIVMRARQMLAASQHPALHASGAN